MHSDITTTPEVHPEARKAWSTIREWTDKVGLPHVIVVRREDAGWRVEKAVRYIDGLDVSPDIQQELQGANLPTIW